MFKPMKRLPILLTLALLAIPASAFFQISGSMDGTLNGTFGQKVIRDNYNKLHLAYATVAGNLVYQNMDLDGSNVSPANSFPSLNFPFNAVNPALGVDHWHNVGIAMITHNGNGTTGSLWYFYTNLNTQTTWAGEELVQNVSEPSIILRNGIAHLTWIENKKVKYMTFPADDPPYLGTGNVETVAETNCNYSGFTKPSISLIHDNCEPDTPVIGYHYYSDETVQVGFQCPYVSTRVGPQVKLFDNATQSWTQIFSNVRAQANPSNLPRYEPTSLSLDACFRSGSIYLAYSDILDGSGRTHVAVMTRTTSLDVPHLTNQASRIDMDANNHFNGGEFRIAYDNGVGSYYRTGQWEPSLPFGWIESVDQQVGGSSAQAPQAILTEHCQDNANQTSIHTIFETHFFNQQALDFDQNLNQCNNVLYDVSPPCPSFRIYVDQYDQGISVSVAEGGAIFEQPTSDSVVFMSGSDRFVIRWEKGDLKNYWSTGFKLHGGSKIFVETPRGREAPEVVYLP